MQYSRLMMGAFCASAGFPRCRLQQVNVLATDFFFQILAHAVFKMSVIQKPNKVAL